MNELQLSEQDKSLLAVVKSFKPTITKYGDRWCCLYGENLQTGIAGFGVNPMNAVYNFWLALFIA